jgi:hypothetical protein
MFNLELEYPLKEKINPCWAASRDICGGIVFKTEYCDETNKHRRTYPKYNCKPRYKKKRLIKINY